MRKQFFFSLLAFFIFPALATGQQNNYVPGYNPQDYGPNYVIFNLPLGGAPLVGHNPYQDYGYAQRKGPIRTRFDHPGRAKRWPTVRR
jgi:hypothetical protein